MARLARQEAVEALQGSQPRGIRRRVGEVADIDNFTDPSTDVSRINSEGIVEGLVSMDYDAVGLGMYELSYTQEDLWALLGKAGLPLMAANLEFSTPALGADHSSDLNELIKPYRLVEKADGFSVGVIHLIDDKVDEVIGKQNGFTLGEAGAAARKVLNAHGEEADYWIVTIADTRQRGTSPDVLAELPGVMQVIGFRLRNPVDEFEFENPKLPIFLDPPYRNARDVVRTVTVFRPGDEPPYIEAKRFAIPDEITPDDRISSIIEALAPRLERLELEEAERALNAQTHPFYLGYETCRKCHEEIVDHQLTMHHAQAMKSLREKGQERSAACVKCHVVGHPNLDGVTGSQGWNLIENQEIMQGVHCESCHGPGEYHATAKYAESFGEAVPADIAAVLSEDGRGEHGIIRGDENTCIVCHDELNSPNFDFDLYWPKIEHNLEMVFTPPEGGGSHGEDKSDGEGH